jgi:phage tail protein X
MVGFTRITVRTSGLTVERVVFKQLGGYVAGVVERTLDRNFGLGSCPVHLPVPITFDVPHVSEGDSTTVVAPIRLVD